jgi:hypothetical protein
MKHNQELEVISYHYNGKLSIKEIHTLLGREKATQREIASVISQSDVKIEGDFFVVPSIMNYKFVIK